MDDKLIVVGRVAGLYGIKGWLKIISHTEPRRNILDYRPWYLERAGKVEQVDPVTGREQGKSLVAQIAGIDDRDMATGLIGATILVNRELFVQTGSNEYYWNDLVGMNVETVDGVTLGVVDSLLATGANDVLIVEGDRRRLIPFIADDVIKRVDLDTAKIMVDWDPEF